MASFSPLIDQLIDALCCLPGIGPKSAQRMAFHLLERNRDAGRHLAKQLTESMDRIDRCSRCRTFSETPICALCERSHRDPNVLCIVESPVDVWAIEQTASFNGYYFVLMGHLSPLDGLGPRELGLDHLLQRVNEDGIQELILATNPTVEGEATAHYIQELVKGRPIKITRIAHGVPLGSELEFIDATTLSRALEHRETMTTED